MRILACFFNKKQKIALWGSGPGPGVTWAKKTWTYSSYDVTHKKIKSKTSTSFQSKLQDFPHV